MILQVYAFFSSYPIYSNPRCRGNPHLRFECWPREGSSSALVSAPGPGLQPEPGHLLPQARVAHAAWEGVHGGRSMGERLHDGGHMVDIHSVSLGGGGRGETVKPGPRLPAPFIFNYGSSPDPDRSGAVLLQC